MAKTTSKKVLTALPMLALAAVPTVQGIAPAFAAEATTATTTDPYQWSHRSVPPGDPHYSEP